MNCDIGPNKNHSNLAKECNESVAKVWECEWNGMIMPRCWMLFASVHYHLLSKFQTYLGLCNECRITYIILHTSAAWFFSALILPFCHRSSSAFFPLSTIRFCETTSFILLYMFFFCFVLFHFPYSLVQWQRMVQNVHSLDMHAILCVLIFFGFIPCMHMVNIFMFRLNFAHWPKSCTFTTTKHIFSTYIKLLKQQLPQKWNTLNFVICV